MKRRVENDLLSLKSFFLGKWRLGILLSGLGILSSGAAEIADGMAGYQAGVKPFFEQYCLSCHGPEKSKGGITVHSLYGDLSAGEELEKWESILDVLEAKEMPPEDEAQPSEAERAALAAWIEQGMRSYLEKASAEEVAATTRRMTNVEYENTLRDLFGVDLRVQDRLLKDPTKPYHFNNTAELMRMGPEQIDRYLEVARYVMASVIVDPELPEVIRRRAEWKPSGNADLGIDEVFPSGWGHPRGSPGTVGLGFPKFPTGEFRIKVKASAILPTGKTEVPLRLVMGYNLNENSSTLQMEPVGQVILRNDVDHPEEFEFRGRIENFPARPGKKDKNGVAEETFTITAQNLFDDGTLNEGDRFLYWPHRARVPRAVVHSIEFEGPIIDVWPPKHHRDLLFESDLRERDLRAYVREVIARFLPRAYRRPVTDEEVDLVMKIYEVISPDKETFEAAMRETLAMVLVSPKFVMQARQDKPGDFALASRLSYFLGNTMPDAELFELAAAGKLSDDTVLAAQVERLLAADGMESFLREFTMQWLSLEKMTTIPINSNLFPRFLYYVSAGERTGTEIPYRPTIRDYLLEETIGFVGEVIRRNDPAETFIDSNYAYLNEALAAHYGVEGVEGINLRPVKIRPEHKLGGLLTHGSVLIGNGNGSAPHPIYRAVWLREAILGDEVAPPPADIPDISETAGEAIHESISLKNALALHREKESCNDCHERLDPWGIPFEEYNAIGQYQPKVPKPGVKVSPFRDQEHRDLAGYREYLETINTVAVESSARVPHGPEVAGMEDLKRHLLKNRKDDLGRNMVRRLVEFGIGRKLTFHDRFALDEIVAAAKENNYRMKDMIVQVCLSELFRKTSTSN